MICRRCKKTSPDSPNCSICAIKQDEERHRRGKYKLIITLGYSVDEAGKLHRKTRSKVYEKRKDAVLGLADLRGASERDILTFRDLYD